MNSANSFCHELLLNKTEDQNKFQDDLDGEMEQNRMKFNRNKCKFFTDKKRNPMHKYNRYKGVHNVLALKVPCLNEFEWSVPNLHASDLLIWK